MLHGTIVQLPDRSFGFEHRFNVHNKPECNRMVWPLINCRRTGYSWFEITDAVGKPAESRDGQVRAYMGGGNYFEGTLPQGGSTQAVVNETTEVLRPKVRRGIETRWHNGRWEKYLKAQGWVAA
jgi:hypothetical protein